MSAAGSLQRVREALELISPAVILLDFTLQNVMDVELFDELKKFTKLPVVIIMTDYSTKESFVKPINEGAVDYLINPIDIETLERELKKY